MPALDGVRAMAVAAVLLYHAEVSWAGGGYLGVDAFFVLSGFLITSLLLAEWRGEGRIALPAFCARRARRLLPALFLVLAAVAAYGALIAAPVELEHLRHDGLSALGYVANWGQIFSHQSYFESFAAPSPLRHTWSLAIEEQFYLVWPLLVAGVLRWRRGSIRSLTAVTGVLLAASAVWMIVLYEPGVDPTRVYYGTDTRAQSLLMGALLALLLTRVRRPLGPNATRALHGGALVAALWLGWIWMHTSEEAGWLYRGGFTLCALLVAIVIASVTRPERGPLGAFLSVRPLRWIGEVSYGLYLWHWPLYVLISQERTGLDGVSLLAARLAASFATATVSFYVVERPIRRGALRRWPARVTAPVTAGVLAMALVFTTGSAVGPLSEFAAADLGPPPTAPATPPGQAGPVRVMVVGDSVANSMGPGSSAPRRRTGSRSGTRRSTAAASRRTSASGTSGAGRRRNPSAHRDGASGGHSRSVSSTPTSWWCCSARTTPSTAGSTGGRSRSTRPRATISRAMSCRRRSQSYREAEPGSCCSRRRTTCSAGRAGCASTGRRTTRAGWIAGTTVCAPSRPAIL